MPCTTQFTSVPLLIESSATHERWFGIDPLPVFSAGGHCEQFWQGQWCPFSHVVHPAFPLPATASSTLQVALTDGFGEANVGCDLPKTCKFPSLDSCHKRFLWTHKKIDLALHAVVSLVLQAGEVSSGTWIRKPGSFFSESASRVHVSQP